MVTLLIGRAQLLGSAWRAGAFNQLVYSQAQEKEIIERIGSVVLGCWLVPQSNLEPIRLLVRKMEDEQQSQARLAQIETSAER